MQIAPAHAERLIEWALADAGLRLPAGAVSARVAGEAWAASEVRVFVRVRSEAAAEWIAQALGRLGLSAARHYVYDNARWEAAASATDGVLASLDPGHVSQPPAGLLDPPEPDAQAGPARRVVGLCERCGKELSPMADRRARFHEHCGGRWTGIPRRITSADTARGRDSSGRPQPVRPCAVCGEPVPPSRGQRSACCSGGHQAEHTRRRNAATQAARKERLRARAGTP